MRSNQNFLSPTGVAHDKAICLINLRVITGETFEPTHEVSNLTDKTAHEQGQ